jgi:hypothetical protein
MQSDVIRRAGSASMLRGEADVTVLAVGPIGFLLLAFIMLARYYYIYFNYYSKVLFRAFVYLDSVPNNAALDP